MDPQKVSNKALTVFSISFIAAILFLTILLIVRPKSLNNQPDVNIPVIQEPELFRKGQMINAYLSGYIRAQKDLIERRNFNDPKTLSLYMDSCAEADILKLKDE